MCRCGIL